MYTYFRCDSRFFLIPPDSWMFLVLKPAYIHQSATLKEAAVTYRSNFGGALECIKRPLSHKILLTNSCCLCTRTQRGKTDSAPSKRGSGTSHTYCIVSLFQFFHLFCPFRSHAIATYIGTHKSERIIKSMKNIKVGRGIIILKKESTFKRVF